MIEINNLTTVSVDINFFKKIANQVLESENKREVNVSIALVGPGRMKKINHRYRKKNRTTDVLSFSNLGVRNNRAEKEIFSQEDSLGEIVICLKEVKKNALKHQVDFKKELARVLIHGILHLLGYDHEIDDETEEMEKKQNHYLSKLVVD